MISLVFVLGMRVIFSVALNRIQALVVGVSFWFGIGCQYGFIFPEHIPNIAGGLLIGAYRGGTDTVLEFTAASGEENLEDRLALFGEGVTDGSIAREVALRLLCHLAAEVRHRQY